MANAPPYSSLVAHSCILYIHGGAYFFGSINTHRYSIWRLARKTRGRAFGESQFCAVAVANRETNLKHDFQRSTIGSLPSIRSLVPVSSSSRPSAFVLLIKFLSGPVSDALAAYLYLIRPPPGAKHRAVDPSKITVSGDSAGGGLCLALLCLIRDSGLPPPAGGKSLELLRSDQVVQLLIGIFLTSHASFTLVW